MKRALLWACLMLPVLQWTQEPIPVWIVFSMSALWILKKNAWVAIMVSALTFIPISLENSFFRLPNSRIVELNDGSVTVATPQGKILVIVEDVGVYHLLDDVVILSFESFQNSPSTYGFDQQAYQTSNAMIGVAKEDQLIVNGHNKLMSFLDSGGFNRHPQFQTLVRAVLFQSDPGSQFIAFISMGLIYMMILKSGKTILSVFMDEHMATLVMILAFIVEAVIFAYPLSLLRVILTTFCRLIFKNGKTRIIVYVLFFQILNPAALTSLSIFYPLVLMILANFKVAWFERWTIVAYVQIILLNRMALLRVVLYPILRILMGILIGLIWVGYVISFLNPILFWSHDVLMATIALIERFMVIRGSLTPLLFALLIGLGWLVTKRVSRSILRALSTLVLFGIPIFSAPWAYQVTFISVGQGDAILLQAPFNQEVILIDTGKPSAYGQVRSFLDAQGIGKLTALILTHDDNDHSGNAIPILNDYQVLETVTEATDIDSAWFHLKALKTTLDSPSDNQASLVTYFTLNKIKFLLMADADEMTEIDLIRQYPQLKADIIKIGHHGSATSTSDALLSTVEARLGIISVGFNDYGHPSQSTLKRLWNYHTKVIMTRKEGDITIILSPFGNFIRFSTMKAKPLGSLFDIINTDKP